MKIGVVVPIFNEARQADTLLQRFKEMLAMQPRPVTEVIFVDDGSTDDTPAFLEKSGVTVLRHEARKGVGVCLRDGINHLLAKHFDIVVIMAGNGKDDPREIPRVTAPILNEDADYVQGSRFLAGGSFKNLPFARRVMIFLYTALWSLLMARKVTDVTNGFRAYRLSLFNDKNIQIDQTWLDTYGLEYYLHYKVLASTKYRFKEVAVSKNYPSRKNYSKIRPILDWWSIIGPLLLLRLGIRR